MKIEEYLEKRREEVNRALDGYLPPLGEKPPLLVEAMRYSVLNGGKRLRAILTLATGEMLGEKSEVIYPFACAIELIHTFTLIHDDLPSMDDDDYRRGKPSTHKAFGENIAVLTGDVLLDYAFQLMSDPKFISNTPPPIALKIVQEVARAIGVEGTVGGQVDDVDIGEETTLSHLEDIYRRKTGSLIAVSVKVGGILGGASPEELECLIQYGEALGLAFQIVDDILDAVGKKGRGGPKKEESKQDYVSIMGLAGARRAALEKIVEAKKAILTFGSKANILSSIANFVGEKGL